MLPPTHQLLCSASAYTSTQLVYYYYHHYYLSLHLLTSSVPQGPINAAKVKDVGSTIAESPFLPSSLHPPPPCLRDSLNHNFYVRHT